MQHFNGKRIKQLESKKKRKNRWFFFTLNRFGLNVELQININKAKFALNVERNKMSQKY